MAEVFDLIAFFEETGNLKRLFTAKKPRGPQQRFLMKRYNITVSQSALFMAVLSRQLEGEESSIPRLANENDLTEHYHGMVRDYFSLLKKQLLRQSGYPHRAVRLTCTVHPDIFAALMKGELEEEPFDPADPFAALDRFSTIWEQLADRENRDIERFESECRSLIAQMGPDNRLAELIRSFSFPEQVMILVAAVAQIESRRTGVDLHEFTNTIFTSLRRRAAFLRDVTQDVLPVLAEGLIILQEQDDNPFSRSPDFTLSPKARDQIFGARKIGQKKRIAVPPFLSHRRWRDKGPELFFDSRLEAELDTVTRALSRSGEGRRLFEKRLKERGLPTGFTALFYGAPGTGKTAAVHELARRVKRDILQVEMAAIRDKWVGESEKRTRAIFTEYRAAAEAMKVMPILLLNEADALLSHRLEARHSVDQMHNTMQNIILEELENFDGILFATTNLTGMLDDAFSRRFLYKLKFPEPTPEVRARIWRSKLPELTEEEARTLAAHPLTGGEIENVARRYIVDTLFSGKPDLDRLEALCAEEASLKKGTVRKVGF